MIMDYFLLSYKQMGYYTHFQPYFTVILMIRELINGGNITLDNGDFVYTKSPEKEKSKALYRLYDYMEEGKCKGFFSTLDMFMRNFTFKALSTVISPLLEECENKGYLTQVFLKGTCVNQEGIKTGVENVLKSNDFITLFLLYHSQDLKKKFPLETIGTLNKIIKENKDVLSQVHVIKENYYWSDSQVDRYIVENIELIKGHITAIVLN